MPFKEFNVVKMYYSIGEVADILDESTSLVRFWTDKFPTFIKPGRNKKGNRKYSPSDIQNLKTIHHLVKDRGMTLEGANKRLLDNKEGEDKSAEIVDRLSVIKEILLDISNSLTKPTEEL
ncbi:MAG: MerR family transcriptional regulator [Bacteroidales bacterium]